jgi:Tol biopolymer transport system component
MNVVSSGSEGPVVKNYDVIDVVEVESDIYIENADGSDRMRVTDTPDIREGGPVWSPDGQRIACTDGRTAKIYVIKLK